MAAGAVQAADAAGMLHALQQLECESPHAGGDGSRPLLLVTTVDIGDGKSDKIEVRAGDVPMDVAQAFVTKHGLPPAITRRLAMHLEENLAKVAAQKLASDHQAKSRPCGGGQSSEDLEVFERLYEQAIALRHKLDERRSEKQRSEVESLRRSKTAMSWISSEMMRDRSSGPFENYGEMLYAESLESLARRREKADRRKAELQVQEVEGATFRPEISRLAQRLWTPHECAAVPAWQRLSKVKMTKAQERLEMLRREKAEAEVRECTFRPQVNTRSERLMTERSATLRSLNVSAHQQLYQDAVRRQQKQQDYQHWYPEEVTFQPKLHESAMSRAFLRRSLGPEGSAMLSASGEERHKALVNRLYASYEKLQNKLQEARSTLQNSVDPTTGRRLFHPETGRAPNFTRHPGASVGEYLYGLKQQQEDKARAAAEERERKRLADAAASKQSQGSKAMVRALQHKRFRQIFDFLDQDGLGSFNLVQLIGSTPEWLDDLDDEVRADLEMATKLLARRCLKHNDSGNSDSSSAIFMPPPPASADALDGTDLLGGGGEGGSRPPSPPGACGGGEPGVVDFQQFCGLMEEVLWSRRGPRAYLAPSPPRRHTPREMHMPQIDERSKQLAAKLRPKDTPLYEVLYQESSLLNQKLEEKRAQAEAELSQACTFAPRLVSHQLVKEGRVMKGMRDGKWCQKQAAGADGQPGELDNAGSLQQLAALVAADGTEAAAAGAMAGGGRPSSRSPGGRSASSSSSSHSPAGERRDLAQPGAPSSSPAAAAAREQPAKQQQQPQSPKAAAAAAGEGDDEYEGSDEQRQYLELEREVQQMLEATSAAAAAAERLQSHTDQQYLSEILGLAQEQVDAMAPVISHLPGLEGRQLTGAAAEQPGARSAAKLAALNTSFSVSPAAKGAGEAGAAQQSPAQAAQRQQQQPAQQDGEQRLSRQLSPRQLSPRQPSPRQLSPRQLSPQQLSPRQQSGQLQPRRRSGNRSPRLEEADLFELAAAAGLDIGTAGDLAAALQHPAAREHAA